MAYSKALEELIEAALADGVLTDKERAVLRKKALLEGVDPEELDVVVEGRLSKMKRETDWLKPAPPAQEKRGNVVKCPNCGATTESGAVKCSECGYVFTNVAANRSSELLAEKISRLMAHGLNNVTKAKVESVILNFPIPTTKEELIEFISSMDAKRKNDETFRGAYKAKLKECTTKAKILFPEDSQIEALLKETTKFSFENITTDQWITFGFIAFFLFWFLFAILISS